MANWRTYINPSIGDGQNTLDGIIANGPTYGIQISDDLNVTGLSTFSDTARFSGTVRLDGQLRDGDNSFGTSGQVLSSDGTDTRWVNAAQLSAGAAAQIAINGDSDTDAERFITFVNSASGNNNLKTDTQLKYNPSTNQLNFTASASGIKFGPGTAGSDDAHIEWLGGSNAGYLRISTSDDGGSEYIQFGDYDNQDKGGTFTQWLRISRDTGTFTGTFSATTFSGSGASLTALNASNLSTGTVNTARLPNTYTKAGQVVVQSTGAGNDVKLDAADHIILESGEEEDGSIIFRGNSGADSYKFSKSGQTTVEGFLSFESLSSDRTFTFPDVAGTVALTSSDITGNSATTTILANSRNFSISGEITANAVSFNGSSNVTLSATVDNNVIDEANLKISNSPTNGRFLQCNTGVSGGLTWAEVSLPTAATLDGTTLASGITASSITSLGTLSSLHVSGTTNLDSGADIDGGQVNIRYDHNTTPALFVQNNAGIANTPIIAQFKGDSDSLIIKNISGGDYEISNPFQTNGIRFYDGTGGVTLVYNNVVSLEFDNGNNFGDFKGVPSVNGVNLARVSDSITGSSGGFTAGNASNLNAGTIPDARLSSSSLFVTGMIMMWSGAISNIPSGWKLCNGNNGTPDLRNKFIIGAWSDGAGSNYPNLPPGQTGGYEDQIVVSHSHTINNHTHGSGSLSATGGNHNHQYIDQYVVIDAGYRPWPANNNDCQQRNVNTSGSGSHTHSISGSTGNPSNRGTDEQGSSGANKNLPPYYALAYIMKVD